MCLILSYQNIAALTPVYTKIKYLKHFVCSEIELLGVSVRHESKHMIDWCQLVPKKNCWKKLTFLKLQDLT